MKNLAFVGVLLLVLGVLAFVVPVPHSEDHGVKIGDAKIGVTTQSSEKLPPAVGIALLVGRSLSQPLGADMGTVLIMEEAATFSKNRVLHCRRCVEEGSNRQIPEPSGPD
jgi:hypothetical protein